MHKYDYPIFIGLICVIASTVINEYLHSSIAYYFLAFGIISMLAGSIWQWYDCRNEFDCREPYDWIDKREEEKDK